MAIAGIYLFLSLIRDHNVLQHLQAARAASVRPQHHQPRAIWHPPATGGHFRSSGPASEGFKAQQRSLLGTGACFMGRLRWALAV